MRKFLSIIPPKLSKNNRTNKYNILIEIEYDGTNYYGWQVQPNRKTIQGEIEQVLSKIYQKPIPIIGACRTDAGVSACGQIANFKLSAKLGKRFQLQELQKKLNAMLPTDIYIKKIKMVGNDFHARFSAKSKIYEYHIILTKSPLKQRFAWFVPFDLNLKTMREAARLFIKHRDYRAFCKVSDKNKNTKCNIKKITIAKRKDEIFIRIEGTRFLYKMARRIVGALIAVGKNHRTLLDIQNALKGKSHKPLVVAPAQGLKLIKVNY
ncbi:MAG: tRNA pseudouridine(38-40) synthase TruA [candidate division WOR-3 bacterium]|nr:tRNA pseudouridine(38-40) synthase TruA [candidate division WOR-3 bacterium]